MEKTTKKQNFEFSLNEVESERLRQFKEKHRLHTHHLVFGEMIKVSFIPSTMGTHAEVQCLTCGETENITDYEKWDI